ncbi:hypothetical protein COCON_G00101620 [Conger conger]|uniref:BtpA domain containing protein n=1 Tax=Conger conger TaxID=82655 RepID=A0A9Q1HYK1_CONCO|nr:hypothetical protein COCON_G00101620 [Conger conger]
MKFLHLFGRLKSIVIGMVHVKALPGTPLGRSTISEIIDCACREAEIYSDAGLDGLIIENMHDIPYTLTTGPEVCACMTAVCSAVRQSCPSLPLGVQILTAANRQALAVALASGLDFVRAEGEIGAERVQIFTDIKKKHSSHALTSDVSVVETARAAEFFLSDGVILTGTATGMEADPHELREVGQSVRIPVLIGSGVTHGNLEHYLDASAMIIGSHFKTGGYWANPVDPERVKRFMGKMHELRL